MNKRSKYLHEKFKQQGALAKKYRQECIGLLPEIYRLRVYKEKNFDSIYEYAAKLAGISKAHVDSVLRLEIKFKDKPNLKKALIKGEVSHHKLARVASIATKDNDKELLEKTKILPNRALEVFVRDIRNNNDPAQFQNEGTKPKTEQKSLHMQSAPLGRRQTLELDEDVETELAELQQKGININEELRQFLQQRKEKIAQEKEKLSQESKPTKTRYIKTKIKKLIQKEHGTKCSINKCAKPSSTIHHTQRFGLTKTHNPKFLAPLCKEHHIIAHKIDLKFHKMQI